MDPGEAPASVDGPSCPANKETGSHVSRSITLGLNNDQPSGDGGAKKRRASQDSAGTWRLSRKRPWSASNTILFVDDDDNDNAHNVATEISNRHEEDISLAPSRCLALGQEEKAILQASGGGACLTGSIVNGYLRLLVAHHPRYRTLEHMDPGTTSRGPLPGMMGGSLRNGNHNEFLGMPWVLMAVNLLDH
jgi:hypothetical protein